MSEPEQPLPDAVTSTSHLTAVVPGVFADDYVFGRYQVLREMSSSMDESSLSICMMRLSRMASLGAPTRPRLRVMLSSHAFPLSLSFVSQCLMDSDEWLDISEGVILFSPQHATKKIVDAESSQWEYAVCDQKSFDSDSLDNFVSGSWEIEE